MGSIRTGFARCIAGAAAAAACLLAAGAPAAAAELLDWDVVTWPAGNLTRTFTVGDGNVVFTFSGNTANLVPIGTGNSPNLSAVLLGGQPAGTDALTFRTDHTNNTQSITITIDFTHAGGVSDVAFSIFDVDALFFNHVDRVVVTGFQGATPIFAAVTTSSCNSFTAPNIVNGTCLSADAGANGNARFVFNASGITRITIVYSNPIAFFSPGIQEISIHDVTFVRPLTLVKRGFLPGGTAIPTGTTVPSGTNVSFLLYVYNAGTAVTDVSLQDVLDPLFAYVPGSIRYDATAGTCAAATCTPAEEAAIFAAAAAGTVGTDPVNADVVSFTGTTLDAGNQNAANAQLDLAGSQVWALVFDVVVE
jgi:hypothetical protein